MLRGESDRRRRVTPLDAFALARRTWLAGDRIEIGPLAAELGIGRATLFRWVGSRELLYGEVIASLFSIAVERARREALGSGAAWARDFTRRLLRALLEAEPLRRFIKQDPEYAIRVLMSKSSNVEARCTAVLRDLLAHEARERRLRCPMDLDSLAYVVLRIGEAFLYRDVITGDPPDIEKAVTAISLLLGARAGASSGGGAAGGRGGA